jgi:hypothetical protein
MTYEEELIEVVKAVASLGPKADLEDPNTSWDDPEDDLTDMGLLIPVARKLLGKKGLCPSGYKYRETT